MGRIVVRIPACTAWRRRQVQLPAQAAGQRQFATELPLVLPEREGFGLTPRARDDRDISSHFRGRVDQESSKVICRAGFRTRRSRIQRSGTGAEGESTPRPEGLRLHQVVTEPPHINAPFEAVVAADLGPDVDNADVGLSAVPGHGGRVTDQRIVAVDTAEADIGKTAGKAVQVYALDAYRI